MNKNNGKKKRSKDVKVNRYGYFRSLVMDAREMEKGLTEVFTRIGIESVGMMLEEDREELAGRKGAHNSNRNSYRYGNTTGEVVVGGRKVQIRKPRIRTLDGKEVKLPSYEKYSNEDALGARVLEQILCSVSTRKYRRSLEDIDEEYTERCTKRSSVSRRFVAISRKKLLEWNRRDLKEIKLAVMMIDGVHMGDHVIIFASGIDIEGKKHGLGMREGSTENKEVCRELLSDIVSRGIPADESILIVIDGGKGLRSAARDVFGKYGVIQRCQIHKEKNVMGHLPEGMQHSVRKAMKQAYHSSDYETAKELLLNLVTSLKEKHPGASRSLEEGLEETLTVNRLELPEILAKTLRSTNVIENMFSSVNNTCRNVKRWRSGSMVERWVCTGIIEAEKRFKRINGCSYMSLLTQKLIQNDLLLRQETLDRKEAVA